MTGIRMKLLKQFNGRREGHVKDYPMEAAVTMKAGGYAEESDEDESPDEVMGWEQDRPGDAAVISIEEKEAENADLREQLEALKAQMQKKGPGRPPKEKPVEQAVTE